MFALDINVAGFFGVPLLLWGRVVCHCSHEYKRYLLLRRKVMTKLDSILKSRDITLPTNVCLVKAIVFPVVMYGCESWTIEKAEYRVIDAFELWCWRRLLRVPWAANRFKQSMLKEISPGYSLERLMLKMKLQYFRHLMQRADTFEKTLMLGKIESRRRRDDREWDGWMTSPTQVMSVEAGSWWWTGRPGMLHFMGSQTVGHDRLTEMNWTELYPMNLPLNTSCYWVPEVLGCNVFIFTCLYVNCISILISSVICWLLRFVWLSLHILSFFPFLFSKFTKVRFICQKGIYPVGYSLCTREKVIPLLMSIIQTYMYAYIHIYIHTHTHIYMHI